MFNWSTNSVNLARDTPANHLKLLCILFAPYVLVARNLEDLGFNSNSGFIYLFHFPSLIEIKLRKILYYWSTQCGFCCMYELWNIAAITSSTHIVTWCYCYWALALNRRMTWANSLISGRLFPHHKIRKIIIISTQGGHIKNKATNISKSIDTEKASWQTRTTSIYATMDFKT